MIISESEFEAITHGRHAAPHELLGMHQLEGGGVVVRALLPLAKGVVAVPVHEPSKPVIALRRVGESDLFEGKLEEENEIYAYDLAITWGSGEQWRTRDAFSFLPTISDDDLYLFNQGDERRIYEKLGSHPRCIDGVDGTSFAVWAPNAHRVSVVGDFNGWDGRHHPMRMLGQSGVWELFAPGCGVGSHYKFQILTAEGELQEKTDPFGLFFEIAPKTASIVWDNSRFAWTDSDWIAKRERADPLVQPMSIYEMHLGSWRKKAEGESFSYRELAPRLVEYLHRMGFTHVEFLPVAEHAYYPSWGYQVTGFYAPSSRYGTPEDFQFLINTLHEAGLGVFIDWVPAHFPKDDWALLRFDGTPLFEHPDPERGEHPDWGTAVFNYGRPEVKNFIAANARFWCDVFHVDGLRVDAVASMLYLDYSRKKGEWTPNIHGGNQNLEAVELLRHTNYVVRSEFPGVVTMAEESTAWPGVTRDTKAGGLGFTFKWDMGWMHDTLKFLQKKSAQRAAQQGKFTFASQYHDQENYMLPLSHDEVVHEKRSLIGRMPGADAESFANMRLLFGYQWLFPGKQLLFMGGEIGQRTEWNEDAEVPWELLEENQAHAGLQQWVADLNHFYRDEPALWAGDYSEGGFYWVDSADHAANVVSFVRQTPDCARQVLVLLNIGNASHTGYRVGLPRAGWWREVLNSDSEHYGGANLGNGGGVHSQETPWHSQPWSAEFTLPPLSCSVFLCG
jgi:1,4-alpha-glucan branching enzyme